MKEMTKEQLDKIKSRLKRASPGPWSNAKGTDIYIGAIKTAPGATSYLVQLGSMDLDSDSGRFVAKALSEEIKDEHFFNSAKYDSYDDDHENDEDDDEFDDGEMIESQSLANADLVVNAPQDIADPIAYVEFLEREMLLNQST